MTSRDGFASLSLSLTPFHHRVYPILISAFPFSLCHASIQLKPKLPFLALIALHTFKVSPCTGETLLLSDAISMSGMQEINIPSHGKRISSIETSLSARCRLIHRFAIKNFGASTCNAARRSMQSIEMCFANQGPFIHS